MSAKDTGPGATAAQDGGTMLDLLELRATGDRDRPVYTYVERGEEDGATWTMGDLHAVAIRIAGALQARGLAGERVVLVFPPGLDYVGAFWGCIAAGVIAVPAVPPDPSRLQRTVGRLRAILLDSGASAILTVGAIADLAGVMLDAVPELKAVPWIAVDRLAPTDAEAWRRPELTPESLCFIQYTSGSTGVPKGVMVSHGNLRHNIAQFVTLAEATSDDVLVSWLPIFHDLGLIGKVLFAVHLRARLYLFSPVDFLQKPGRWLKTIARVRGTISYAPNFAYDLTARKVPPAERAGLDLSSWRLAGNAAEPVLAATHARFYDAFAPCGLRPEALRGAYGLAECTVGVTGKPTSVDRRVLHVDVAALQAGRVVPTTGGAGSRALVHCGVATEHVELRIVNPETLAPCGPTEIGELWLRGPSVALGYWRRPDETVQVFGARVAGTGEGPYLRTGDLGFLHDGLFLTGREKELLIVRGANHYPHDLELSAEASHPLVRPSSAMAFTLQGVGEVPEPELVIVAEIDARKNPGPAELDAVIAAIVQAVAESHELALAAVALAAPGVLPKTSSGKKQRGQARRLFVERPGELLLTWRRPRPEGARAQGAPTPVPPPTGPRMCSSAEARRFLIERLAARTGVAAASLDVDAPFARFGLSSVELVELTGELSTWLGRDLDPVLGFEHSTIARLARHVAGEAPALAVMADGAPVAEPVAVVGIGCRFPGGASDPRSYWALLRDGIDAVGEVTADRWDVDALFDPETEAPGKMTTRWAGLLADVAGFDATFFGIAPREAELMDPQQRIVLEVAWEAIEDAGLDPRALAGSRTGVFVGVSSSDYGHLVRTSGRTEASAGTGSALSIVANRISYVLDLQGPSLAVDTACSSSLVAIDLALRALARGDCDLALAGGVNLILSPDPSVIFSKARMMSPTGRCRTFDADADGYVRGEGAGLLLLKPLGRALADGDAIYAVLRGSAVNQDGRSNGLTAPNGAAQRRVLEAACRTAGVAPRDVQVVEAHGTGTPLGDPIEAQALGDVLGAGRAPGHHLLVGSVKTQLGHLEAAAGVASAIKMILALHHRQVPASLHFRAPNPRIPWDRLPLEVPTTLRPWPDAPGPRLAGVSSFGFGGTNAHLVLAEAPPEALRPTPARGRPVEVVVVSGRSDEALDAQRARLAAHLGGSTDALGDVAFTLGVARVHQPVRAAIVAADLTEAARALAGPIVRAPAVTDAPRVAFLFAGQGAQHPGMGRALAAAEPTYRQALERLDARFAPGLGRSLVELMHDAAGDPAVIEDTLHAQPALFAMEVALAELWRSWGVTPVAVLGHSIGELAAATVAGLLDEADAVALVLARARALHDAPRTGGMASVWAEVAQVEDAIARAGAKVSIAAVSSPRDVTISGERAALEAVIARLRDAGIVVKPLRVSHAFHSECLDQVLPRVEQAAGAVSFRSPRVPIVSNVSGRVGGPELGTAAYWARQVRQPVRFADGVGTLVGLGVDVFLELGPDRSLLAAARASAPEGASATFLSSLLRAEDDARTIQTTLARLFERGAPIDFAALHAPSARRRVSIPTTAFVRSRHWVADLPAARAGAPPKPMLGTRLPVAGKQVVFESSWGTPEVAFLNDHRLFGQVVVPAATYLSIGLALGRELFGAEPCGVRDLTVHDAFAIGDGERRRVQIVANLDRDVDAVAFEVFSLGAPGDGPQAWWRAASGVVHRSALSGLDAPLAGPGPGARPVGPTEVYARYRQHGMDYGPAFQLVGEARVDGNTIEAELDATSGSDEEASPRVLDAALQVIGLGVSELADRELALPVGVDRFVAYAPLRGRLRATARLSHGADAIGLRGDVVLRGPDGTLVAEILGVTLQRTNAQAVRRSLRRVRDDWVSGILWPLVPQPTGERRVEGGRWVLFEDEDGVGRELAAALAARGAACVLVRPGHAFAGSDAAGYTIDPRDPTHLARVLAERGGAPDRGGVIYLWSLDRRPEPEVGQRLRAVLEPALHVLQGVLAGSGAPAGPLFIVTRGAHLLGRARIVPEQSALWGLGRVVRGEHVGGRLAQIDADPDGDERLASALLGPLLASDGEDEVALRAGGRHVARVSRRGVAPPGTSPPIRGGAASYVVTGGLGGIGLALAQWLCDAGAGEVVLIGRRAPDAAQRAALGALRPGGTEVRTVIADVGVRAELARVLDELRGRGRELRGVFHAAGVLDDGLLAGQTWARFAPVLASKAIAAHDLDELTRRDPLDLFVLFSSAAAILGSTGQASYVAANAYLAGLAHARAAAGLPALCIDWGPWEATGMTTRLEPARRHRWEQLGMRTIPPRQGLDLLDWALGRSATQLTILPMDWATFVSMPEGRAMRLTTDLAPMSARRRPLADARPEGLRERLAGVESGAPRRELLRGALREAAASVLGMSGPLELSPERRLVDYGLDSMMAIDLRDRVSKSLGIMLPATVAFDHPTIDRLTDHLLGQVIVDERAIDPAAARGAPRADDASSALAIVGLAIRADLAPGFDPAPFGLAPAAAGALEPQIGAILEAAYEALLQAGLGVAALDRHRTGVFVAPSAEAHVAWARDRRRPPLLASVASSVARHLGARGPTLAVETGDAGSLLALHLGAQALRAGEVATAIVAAVGVDLAGAPLGAIAVVLRPLADAVAAGDRILGVLEGEAVADAEDAEGGGAPRVLERAAIAATDVRYVELASATGLDAIVRALGPRTPSNPLLVGVVGARAAAPAARGLAGLASVLGALATQRTPSAPHDLVVPEGARAASAGEQAWPAVTARRFAAVAAADEITRVVAIVGTPPEVAVVPSTVGPRLLPLSAASPASLASWIARLARYAADPPEGVTLADVARTLARRPAAPVRAAVIATSLPELARALEAGLELSSSRAASGVALFAPHDLVVARGLGQRLVALEPSLRGGLEQLRDQLGAELADGAWAYLGLGSAPITPMASDVASLAIAASLAELLRSVGLRPTAIGGAGLGELHGAVLCGAVAPADGARLLGWAHQGYGAPPRVRVTAPHTPPAFGTALLIEQVGAMGPLGWIEWQARCTLAAAGDPRIAPPAGELVVSLGGANAHDVRLTRPALDDGSAAIDALAALWRAGAPLDWRRLHRGGRVVELPPYPFAR